MGVSGHIGHPLEQHEENESQDGGGDQHEVAKGDVLRVVACGLSDGSRRERLFLVLGYCFIVAVEGSENDEGHV